MLPAHFCIENVKAILSNRLKIILDGNLYLVQWIMSTHPLESQKGGKIRKKVFIISLKSLYRYCLKLKQ